MWTLRTRLADCDPWKSQTFATEVSARNMATVMRVVRGFQTEIWPPGTPLPCDTEADENLLDGDARVMTAGPELLAACIRLANLCANCCPASASGDEAIAEAKAAIRKATGKE